MRKEYAKVLRDHFSRHMPNIAPQFEEVKVKSMYFWAGDRAFRWAVTKDCLCWIILSPDKKGYDEFKIFIGWSRMGRYPELRMVPCPDLPTSDRSEFLQEEYLMVLPNLWSLNESSWVVRKFRPLKTNKDFAESLKAIPSKEAKELVIPIADEALNKIKEFALPYFEEYIKWMQNEKNS